MGNEPKFTIKQLITIAGALSAISGAGGAMTVMANDQVQDSNIDANRARIVALEGAVRATADITARTEEKVEAVQRVSDEVRRDVKEIQSALDKILGRMDAEGR